jgi:hypothetical protein
MYMLENSPLPPAHPPEEYQLMSFEGRKIGTGKIEKVKEKGKYVEETQRKI